MSAIEDKPVAWIKFAAGRHFVRFTEPVDARWNGVYYSAPSETVSALRAEIAAKDAELAQLRDAYMEQTNSEAWWVLRCKQREKELFAAIADLAAFKEDAMGVLEPFSVFAGELFARNYENKTAVVTLNGQTPDGYTINLSLTADAFFAARTFSDKLGRGE